LHGDGQDGAFNTHEGHKNVHGRTNWVDKAVTKKTDAQTQTQSLNLNPSNLNPKPIPSANLATEQSLGSGGRPPGPLHTQRCRAGSRAGRGGRPNPGPPTKGPQQRARERAEAPSADARAESLDGGWAEPFEKRGIRSSRGRKVAW